MKDLLMFILVNLKSFGELKSVKMYDTKYSNLEFETENSVYEITIRREDKGENEDANIV